MSGNFSTLCRDIFRHFVGTFFDTLSGKFSTPCRDNFRHFVGTIFDILSGHFSTLCRDIYRHFVGTFFDTLSGHFSTSCRDNFRYLVGTTFDILSGQLSTFYRAFFDSLSGHFSTLFYDTLSGHFTTLCRTFFDILPSIFRHFAEHFSTFCRAFFVCFFLCRQQVAELTCSLTRLFFAAKWMSTLITPARRYLCTLLFNTEGPILQIPLSGCYKQCRKCCATSVGKPWLLKCKITSGMVARFFLIKFTKTEENIPLCKLPNGRNKYIPNSHKIYQHFPFQGSPKLGWATFWAIFPKRIRSHCSSKRILEFEDLTR
jgi:hypothetical protein